MLKELLVDYLKMKKLLVIVVILIVIGGYYTYDKNQKLNKSKKATKICLDHFKTSDQECLDSHSNYAYKISKKKSNERWSEYKKKVKKIEDKIDDLKNLKPSINLLDYSYTSANEITSYQSEEKLKNKQILIAGGNSGYNIFEPTCYLSGYYVCLKQETYNDNGDTETRLTEVFITNIDAFPKIKNIIDELDTYAFYYYKTVVYGTLDSEDAFEKKIKADYITLETYDINDDTYEDALMNGVYSIKRKEYLDYMKKNYLDPKRLLE